MYIYIHKHRTPNTKHQSPNQQHETSKQVLHFPVDLVVWGDVRLEVHASHSPRELFTSWGMRSHSPPELFASWGFTYSYTYCELFFLLFVTLEPKVE